MDEIVIIDQEIESLLLTIRQNYTETIYQKLESLLKERELYILDVSIEKRELLIEQGHFIRSQLVSLKPQPKLSIIIPEEPLQLGKKIQDTDIKILRQCNHDIEEASAIGAATLEELTKQGETLEHIRIDLGTIDSNTTRTQKTLKNFILRLRKDVTVWILIFLIIASIVVIITVPPVLVLSNNNSTLV